MASRGQSGVFSAICSDDVFGLASARSPVKRLIKDDDITCGLSHLRFKNQARLPSDGAPSFVTAFIRLFARRTDGTSTASCSAPAVDSIALGYSNSSRKDESPSVRAAPTTRARRRSPRDGFRACA